MKNGKWKRGWLFKVCEGGEKRKRKIL